MSSSALVWLWLYVARQGWGGMYPIGLPIRRYDSALKSCQPTSAAQHPNGSARIMIKTPHPQDQQSSRGARRENCGSAAQAHHVGNAAPTAERGGGHFRFATICNVRSLLVTISWLPFGTERNQNTLLWVPSSGRPLTQPPLLFLHQQRTFAADLTTSFR